MLLLFACAPPAALVSDPSVTVHPDVSTLLEVRWAQAEAVEAVRVEYQVDGVWTTTPTRAVDAGRQSEVLLGIPPETVVDVRIVETVDGVETTTDVGTGETGPLPADFPVPSLVTLDEAGVSAAPWLLVTVATGEPNYKGPWWMYILDRQARVVWYRALWDDRVSVMSRVSADGTHLTWSEASWFADPPTIERATLDGRWSESLEAPELGYTYDELPDGTFAYDSWHFDGDIGIRTLAADGTTTDVWSCTDWEPEGRSWGDCGSNTVNYDETRGTYLWSLYDLATVVEVDPSGVALASWGDFGDDPLTPKDARLQMPHYPNWTADGTLLLSAQVAGEERVQFAREFALEPDTGGLEQVWSYATDERYAECSGEAVRVEGGNTLLNYGCGAAIREVTPDGEVVWDVETGALIGHQTPIADLYAVNRGR